MPTDAEINFKLSMKEMRRREYEKERNDKKMFGTIIILFYHFPTGTYREFERRYYYSKKGRLCFRFGAGLFEGMRFERLEQFEYDRDVATMYVLEGDQHFHRYRANFLQKVLRFERRHHAKAMAKFVGGNYGRKPA